MLDHRFIHDLVSKHRTSERADVAGFDVKGRTLDFTRERLVVGVINLSSDSWYRESVATTEDAAVERGLRLVEEGADIVDIGAESTLPDAARRDVRTQIDLLVPVVSRLAAKGVLVSVESYHPEVLDACARAGAAIFNLTGTRAADEVFELARDHAAGVVLCFVQGPTVREVGDLDVEEDMTPRLLDYFGDLTARARARGVTRCFVDPGLGFYYRNLTDSKKRVGHQMRTFLNAFRLHELGYPVFNILPHAPEVFREDERRAAEPFFSVLALIGGTHVIRSHEVRTVARVREMMLSFL